VGLGVFLGYQPGEAGGFEWGFEAFATHHFEHDDAYGSGARTGIGPLLQLSTVGLRDSRMSLAVQGGGELSPGGAALTGELGLSYRMGEHGGLGIHTGITSELSILNAAFRYQWLLNEAWIGGGIRYVPSYTSLAYYEAVPGRPFRTDRGRVHMSSAERLRAGDRRAAVDCDELEYAGLGYERDAQLECASIPAFLQLARELERHDAPQVLVTRALAAAADELHHAKLCADLATGYLQRPVAPVWPNVPPRAALAGSDGVVQLAVESWIDGCVMEGIAAAQAAYAARECSDRTAQPAQRVIAADEQRHAELAWSILEWALRRGGEAAHAALCAVRTVDAPACRPESALAGVERYGRPDARALDRVACEQLELSRKRLDAVLAARS
jgi:hypothetical protein